MPFGDVRKVPTKIDMCLAASAVPEPADQNGTAQLTSVGVATGSGANTADMLHKDGAPAVEQPGPNTPGP